MTERERLIAKGAKLVPLTRKERLYSAVPVYTAPTLDELAKTANIEIIYKAGQDNAESKLVELTATENKEYTPEEGKIGFSKVTVNVAAAETPTT